MRNTIIGTLLLAWWTTSVCGQEQQSLEQVERLLRAKWQAKNYASYRVECSGTHAMWSEGDFVTVNGQRVKLKEPIANSTWFTATYDYKLTGETHLARREESLSTSPPYLNEKDPNADYMSQGYRAVRSEFTLGYLLAALSNRVLAVGDPARDEEVAEHLKNAVRANPALADLCASIKAGTFNTVLVVGYGFGPEKYAWGKDNRYSDFRARQPWGSTPGPLQVRVGEVGEVEPFPVVNDLNAMAADHVWRGFEEYRVFKSKAGQALQAAGAIAVASGYSYAQYVGYGMLLAGTLMRASAKADTRYCEILPQVYYLAPVSIREKNTTVEIQVEGDDVSRMALVGLDPPRAPDRYQLRYVRIPPTRKALPWMTSEVVMYANDQYEGPVDGDTLPYILGGTCVRKPTSDALAHYQKGGNLEGFTVSDLQSLYRDEGIILEPAEGQDVDQSSGLHVLEGGNSLETPLPGTAGFQRLFCQQHKPYKPKSEAVKALYKKTAASGKTASNR